MKMTALRALFAVVLPVALGSHVHAKAPDRDVQPEALQAIADVSRALDRLETYAVETDVRTRAAVGAGRYRDFEGVVRYRVKRPTHLFAEVQGDRINRRIRFDGAQLVVEDPTQRRHARLQATGDLRSLLVRLKEETGIELPIADFFGWTEGGTPMAAAERAKYAGTAKMGGRDCRHYTYKESDVLWDLWVDEQHLPCKLVTVDMKDAGLPGYRADFKWSPVIEVDDAEFTFVETTPSTEVTLAELSLGEITAKP